MRFLSRRIASLVLLSFGALAEVAMATEEPKHRVLETRDAFEVGLYEPQVVAETVVEGEFGDGGNEGFRRIAGYIFGGNDGGRKIVMTAPVAQQKTGEGWTVAFIMPSDHTMATLPKPHDPRVALREVPARRVATVTFSGTWGAERFDTVARELLGKLDAAGFVPAGPPVYARYDPPWTPWFLRKNEVLVPLRDGPGPVAVR